MEPLKLYTKKSEEMMNMIFIKIDYQGWRDGMRGQRHHGVRRRISSFRDEFIGDYYIIEDG